MKDLMSILCLLSLSAKADYEAERDTFAYAEVAGS